MAYQPLDAEEPVRDSIDHEDSFVLQEKTCGTCERRQRFQPWTYWLLSYSVVVNLLAVLLTMTLFANVHQSTGSGSHKDKGVSAKTVTFGRDFQYMSVEHQYDDLWKDWTVEHVGDGDSDGEKHKISGGVITMFYQLHCLSTFHRAIQLGHEGVDPGLDWKDNGHWPHCFDYMRKSILCWADDTLETQARVSNRTHTLTTDGSLDERQCRDSTKLIEMAKKQGLVLPNVSIFGLDSQKSWYE